MKYLNQLPLTAAFRSCDSASSRGARLLRSLLWCPALVFLLASFFLAVPPAYADGPTFTVRRPFGTGWDLTASMAVGDLDGDDDLDIVVGNKGPNVVYLNDGAGNFATERNFGTGSDATASVAVGDLDGDGDLDIVVGNYDEQNMVYLNDGAGNFAVGHNFGTGSDRTQSVAVGDLDGDGHLDIVVGNESEMGEQNVVLDCCVLAGTSSGASSHQIPRGYGWSLFGGNPAMHRGQCGMGGFGACAHGSVPGV